MGNRNCRAMGLAVRAGLKKAGWAGMAIASLGGWSGVAHGDLIDVDFTAGTGQNQTGAAVLGNAGDVWNGLAGSSGSSTLTDVANLSAGVNLSFFGSGNYSDSGGTAMDSATSYLMQSYIYSSTGDVASGQTFPMFSLTGLAPNTNYELVVYAAGNGVGQGANIFANGTAIGSTNAVNRKITSGNGAAYVDSTAVSSDSNGNLVVTTTNNSTAYAAINGFQLSGLIPGTQVLTYDSSGVSPGNPVDGSGTFDMTTPLFSNGTSDQAFPAGGNVVFGNGQGSNQTFTITLGGNVAAGSVTLANAGNNSQYLINTGGYKLNTNRLSVASGATGGISGGTVILPAGTGITLAGTLLLDGGTLNVASIAGSGNTGDAQTVYYNGVTLQPNTAANFGGAVNNFISTNGLTVDTSAISGTSTTVTFNVPLSHDPNLSVPDGGLTKVGANTLFLNARNTYTGPTAVNGGTLELGNGGNTGILPSGTLLTVNAGGTVSFSGTDSVGYGTGQIAGIVVNGGTLTTADTGSRATLPTLTFTGGTLASAPGNATDSSGNYSLTATVNTIASASTVSFTASEISLQQTTTTFNVARGTAAVDLAVSSKVIDFNGSPPQPTGITKSGAGIMTLTAVNTYSGNTNINAGTLSISPGAVGTVGNVVFNGGTLQFVAGAGGQDLGSRINNSTAPVSIDTNGNNVTFTTPIGSSNAAGLTKIGSGVLTIAGANSYAGTTSITGGTLRLNAPPPSLPTAGLVLDLDASTLGNIQNGASVTTLGDSSPSHNTAVATGSSDPTYNAPGSAGSLNGLGTINFNGNGQGLATSTPMGLTGNASQSIFVVMNRTGTGGMFVDDGTPGAHGGNFGIADNSDSYHGPTAYYDDLNASAQPSGTYAVYAVIHNGVGAASSTDTGYVNGNLVTSGTLDGNGGVTYNNGNGPAEIGWRGVPGAGGGDNANGNFGEYIIYNTALTAAQIQQVNAYLTDKWFGTLASTSLPSSSPVVLSAGGTLDLNGNNTSVPSVNSTDPTTQILLGSGGTLSVGSDGSNSAFAGSVSGAGNVIKLGSGSFSIGGASSYTGTTNVSAGSMVVGANPGSGIAVRPSAGLVIASGSTLTFQSAAAAANRSLIVVGSVNLAPGATLDLGGNDMDITATPLGTINQAVASGYNLAGGGKWSGTGITSTAAATSSNHLTALGVIQNNQGGAAIYGSGPGQLLFDGTAPGPSDILVKYTYVGDANLDGKVDGSDYSRIDTGYAGKGTLTGWYNGDFNYDGVIDGSDYALIDNAFDNQTTTLSPDTLIATNSALSAGPASAVPEPASLSVVCVATLVISRRRRQR